MSLRFAALKLIAHSSLPKAHKTLLKFVFIVCCLTPPGSAFIAPVPLSR